MANVFNIQSLAGTIAAAKDKALALAGEYGLNDILGGRVLPPLPPYPAGGIVEIAQAGEYEGELIEQEDADNAQYTIIGTPMCFPLSIKLKSDTASNWWLLPTEPIITLGGGHQLVRRNVSKARTKGKVLRGSIKERWALDDYTITIDGLFTKLDNWTYPQDDAARLRAMLEAREAIEVKCQLFEIFGIGRIVAEKWDIPFTKGPENQAYKITAYSDDDWGFVYKN